MKGVIIDDNAFDRQAIKQFLQRSGFVEVIADFDNPIEAIKLIQSGTVDLVLLDIEMPEMSGMDFLKINNHSPLVILMSAKPDYALEAFEYNVVDYLLKPVQPDRMLKAINRAGELFESKNHSIEGNDKDVLFIREKGVLNRVKTAEINFIQAMGDYILLQTCSKRYTVRMPMKTLESKLPLTKFFRVHRSYMVALEKVETIEENTISIDGTLIPLGDQYKAEFFKRLNLI